ncbi:FAD:protein FMN transferase [Lutispora thermophila]|uniref:FAD:protein FMN transferase n=1 Tax=Lutispora thermophila DSM 19022 TaxID=1122184 RepID=A0A1M6DJQ8_9FIRM|nr:FAD:protein FMN transferase [Lutispora thermophila]SHI73534.1 thiamine biosynthesis lipoprotein [Lutispora thermophila DSM 19022]
MKFINKKNIILLLILSIFCSLSIGCIPKENQSNTPLTKSNYLLGTQVSITLYDSQNERIIDEAFKRISEIESKMSINNENPSEITKLNEASGTQDVKLSEDTFYVLEKGRYYSKLSDGKFDITIGPLVKLWNIGTSNAAIPDNNLLVEKLKLVDYNKLSLNKDNLTAKLELSGMIVDLGGIAKGYAADEVATILKKHGVNHAIINLGGNILALGANVNKQPWKIGIQDPFYPRNDYMGIVEVIDKAVVTSGIYERYFEVDGKRYHHILDPKTGYPADNGLAGVSIITDKSIDADGLSTSIFLLGVDKGLELIESLDNTEAIFITTDKKVYLSSGLKSNFTLVNKEYTIMN